MTIYRIGDVEFDPDACEIYTEGHLEHLQPQVRNVLLCLVKHQGEVVPRAKLVEEAWGGRRTSDESVTRCISLLRKHLADRNARHVIETIPKTGYRLLEQVQLDSASHCSGVERVGVQPPFPDNRVKSAIRLLLAAGLLLLLASLLLLAR